ncbi:MAG: adenylate/guanylate cyclase domain-containing protein, partial [Spirochaetales bacterium]|nr:adenylate/guanylate cyclase domain-containing protein [Spirochaetales bacterium]
WSVWIIAVIVNYLAVFGLVPVNIFTYNATLVGTAFEVVLISFALGYKIQLFRKEKEEAQAVLIEQQKKSLATQIKLKNSFSRFVPREFLQFLNRDSIVDVRLGDQVQKSMTILFSDIRSFTSLSEKMSPQENFNFINSYFSRIAPIIRRYNGFIDKYIGDAIMAIFDGETDKAVEAAIAIQNEIVDYNDHRRISDYEPIESGIGMHTGSLILGTVGGEERMDTTVISDVVNSASRLEGLTRIYGSQIIISGYMRDQLTDPSQFNFRLIDFVKVKGKSMPMHIYEVLDSLKEARREAILKVKRHFEKAVQLYHNKKVEDSYKLFHALKKRTPDDRTTDLYIKRCKQMIDYGIPDGWDGITLVNEK